MRGGLATLKTRADFLRVAAARHSAAAPGVVVQAAVRPKLWDEVPAIRVGFTASRKVGNAVTRNRAKRRLRAVASTVLPSKGRPGTDYVLIARSGTAGRAYAALLADLEAALRRVDGRGGEKRRAMAEEKG